MPKKTYALCQIQDIVQFESPCFMSFRALIGGLMESSNPLIDMGGEVLEGRDAERF
ncbi:hypothetical protein D3C87_2029460 [compost metagenome]